MLIPVDGRSTDLTPLTTARIPLVLVDRWVEGAATDLVATDNVDAGRQAAAHLAERGFTRPVVLTGPADLAATEDRVRGFVDTWAARGVEMRNLIGDQADAWQEILRDPANHLHLYGKGAARPGRKMGHVTRLIL